MFRLDLRSIIEDEVSMFSCIMYYVGHGVWKGKRKTKKAKAESCEGLSEDKILRSFNDFTLS